MSFQQFNKKIQHQFTEMCKHGKLFRSSISGADVWKTYIEGFKPGEDPIFRDPNSTEHTCNTDNNFIRRYGNIVAIDKNNNILTLFDIDVTGTVYENTIPALAKVIRNAPVENIFLETFAELNVLPYEKIGRGPHPLFQLGVKETFKRYSKEEVDKYGRVNLDDTYHFHHFHIFLPEAFVDKSGKSIESIMAEYRDDKTVFERVLSEISADTFKLVIDLIKQGSLLNGDTYLAKVEKNVIIQKRV